MSLFRWEATLSVANATPCSEVFVLNLTSDRCDFVSSEPDCADIASKLNYLQWYFCHDAESASLAAYAGTLAVFFAALAVAADGFLCPNLATMAKTLRFSDNLAGVTFLALGNGAPDVFSSIAGASQSRPHLVLGALFGAAVFVTTVVAGSVCVAKPFKVMRRPFLRDVSFFLTAGLWAFYICYTGQIRWFDPFGFLILYGAYMTVVVLGRIMNRRMRARRGLEPLIDEDDDHEHDFPEGFLNIFVPQERISEHEVVVGSSDEEAEPDDDETVQNIMRESQGMDSINGLETAVETEAHDRSACTGFILALNPLGNDFKEQSILGKLWLVLVCPLSLMFRLTVPVVDINPDSELEDDDDEGWCRLLHVCQCYTAPLFVLWAVGAWEWEAWPGVQMWVPVLIAGQLLALLLSVSSSSSTKPSWNRILSFLGFAVSALWIYAVANEIVSLLRTLGVIFGIPDAILGLSVLAWGNSVGDLVSDVTLARRGFPRMGFSGCFGGPLFNLLLGIGLPYSMLFLHRSHSEPVSVSEDPVVILLCGALGVSLVTSALLLCVSGFHARRWFGGVLIALYVAFMAAAVTVQLTWTETFLF